MPKFAAVAGCNGGRLPTCLLLLFLLLLRSGTNNVVNGQAPVASPSVSLEEPTFVPTLTMSPTQTPQPTPTFPPFTLSPTSSTQAPSLGPRECWNNLTELYFHLEQRPPFSSNTYVLCPNTTYDVGYKEGSQGGCCVNGELPLVCRANTHFKCGEDGSRQNNSVLSGGSDQIVFNEVVFDEELTGVVMQGITFRGAVGYTMIGVGGGDITFLGCLFEVSRIASLCVVETKRCTETASTRSSVGLVFGRTEEARHSRVFP